MPPQRQPPDTMNQESSSTPAEPRGKPTVIGIYGLPGCGKSFLLNQLRSELPSDKFLFFDGSEVIASLVRGGLQAFRKLDHWEQHDLRGKAIKHISKQCEELDRVGIVAGHFSFWPVNQAYPDLVWTQRDASVYTHIVYLAIDPSVIAKHRANDVARVREPAAVDHLAIWQCFEISLLRLCCWSDNKVLLSKVSTSAGDPSLLLQTQVQAILEESRLHSLERTWYRIVNHVEGIVESFGPEVETMLVFDADNTLAGEDTGLRFWETLAPGEKCPLKELFKSRMGYSYEAFHQASLLYGEVSQGHYDAVCAEVAASVSVQAELIDLISKATALPHVGVVIVTCGQHQIWDRVVARAGLSDKVRVIGAGRAPSRDALLITPTYKGAIVKYLQEFHRHHVIAFGDSPLDLLMLRHANEAIVVVGPEATRSKSMDDELEHAITHKGLRARQILLPSGVSNRLHVDMLPIIDADDPTLFHSIATKRRSAFVVALTTQLEGKFQICHATDLESAKVLMTRMRDARVSGPALREVHRQVGWHIGACFLSKLLGLESYPIPHVQGGQTDGFRLAGEDSTIIVALMRGDEPMAFGVNDAFPTAGFIHAKDPEDLRPEHLQDVKTVILVDSVINTGKSVSEMVRRIRSLDQHVRVAIAAGVVQSQCISEGEHALEKLAADGDVYMAALRLSDNKYTGRGGTDTGNRLFNTTRLE